MIRICDDGDAFAVPEVRELQVDGAGAHAGELRSALARHALLCLRMDHALTDEALQAVARLFGPIKDPVGRAKDGSVLCYDKPRQVIDAGFVMTDEVREKLGELSFGGLDDRRPGLFETFHCDDTYTEEPAAATVLHARTLPGSGSCQACRGDGHRRGARPAPVSAGSRGGPRTPLPARLARS